MNSTSRTKTIDPAAATPFSVPEQTAPPGKNSAGKRLPGLLLMLPYDTSALS
jgi:hypothetical protein